MRYPISLQRSTAAEFPSRWLSLYYLQKRLSRCRGCRGCPDVPVIMITVHEKVVFTSWKTIVNKIDVLKS